LSGNGVDALDRLSGRFGIIGSYRDFDGNEIVASPETKRALLLAMGADAKDEDAAGSLLAELEEQDRARRSAPEIIVSLRLPSKISLNGPCDWRLVDETGNILGTGVNDSSIVLPALESGIYEIDLAYPSGNESVTVIAAPQHAPTVANVSGHARLWGMTASLYSFRSDRNIGMGDYADLGAAAEALGKCGAQFLGINPVHALGFADSQTISPYSPTSRSFYNIAHIAFDAIPELTDSEQFRDFLNSNRAKIEALRNAKLVDYPELRSIRQGLFDLLFEIFCARESQILSGGEFAGFAEEPGNALRLFGLYETLSELHGPDCRKWPTELQAPDSPAVSMFQKANRERIGFHCWLQRIADTQLAAAQARAKSAGMALGLYLDISVGSRPGGAECWANPLAVASGVSIGAPPDAFSPDGQNWNLAPYSPEGLRRARYKPFINMLRSSMRHAGMVRIDHALGLSRSFWIPGTGEPGGYVRYPLDALLAIIAMEAERSGTVVIGEDLGLVAPDFREKLQAAGLYGCAVMQFERNEGHFHDPRGWREMSLGSFGTHDTPTFEGFRQARDVEWGAKLARGRQHDAGSVRTERRKALGSLFGSMGLGAESDGAHDDCSKMHAALANAGSALVAAQLDDALEAVEQQNLPGTIDEHPNWRRRYESDVSDLAEDERIRRIGRIMERAGRSGSSN